MILLTDSQITQLIDAWKKVVANPGEGDDGNIIQSILNTAYGSFNNTLLDDIKRTTRVLTSVEVLALNTTPIEIVPAPGANKALVPFMVESFVNFNSAAYATNTDLLFEYGSAGTQIAILTGALAATADAVSNGPAVNLVDEALNQAIDVTEGGADPITGNSPVTVTVYYFERTFTT
jgi:hypothetical protein